MKNFKLQMVICIILVIFLSLIKTSTNEKYLKIGKAVSLIVTQETDIREEAIKIKNFFTEDDDIKEMSPVSEFILPVKKGKIVKGFGVQDAENSGFHYGVDIKTSDEGNVLSVADGEVIEIATNQEYGTYIIIKHSDKISTLYARLNEILPGIGEKVKSGQIIARTNAEDKTLHFEIKRNDTYLDPADFIDFGAIDD